LEDRKKRNKKEVTVNIQIPKLPKFSEVPWKSWGLALVLLLGVLHFWNKDHNLKTDALRSSEAMRLTLANQIVADQDSKGELQASLKDELAKNDLLREAYEELLKAAPDAKVEGTAVLKTAPTQALAKADPIPEPDSAHPPPLPPCDKPYVPDGHGGFICPEAPAPKKSACLFDTGSFGSFKVDEIVLGTDKGNKLISATAEFWRESPLPRTKLLAGKFVSGLSNVDTLAAPTPPRWGMEIGGLCTAAGCGLGAGVLLPPFKVPLLGLQGEARADLYAGPVLGASAWLGVRW